MRWNTYIARKLLSGGYGMLYNWFCTQAQAAGEYEYLYNWYAISDMRNICSSGWHIPTRTELTTLRTYLGGNSVFGGKLKESGTLHWSDPNVTTTPCGFNAVGSGYRADTGIFNSLRAINQIGSSTYNSTFIICTQVSAGAISGGETFVPHSGGVSLHPMKDSTILTNGQTGTYIDPSGIIYPTICIGTQEWVSCNIMTRHYRNGDAIPEVTDNTVWAALTTGARCSYNNLESNAGTTKKLSSSEEWVVPTDVIAASLISFIGGNEFGYKLQDSNPSYWIPQFSIATNELLFSARGTGQRGEFGAFSEFGRLTTFHLLGASDSFVIQSFIDSFTDVYTTYDDTVNSRFGNCIRLCNPTTLNAEGSVNSYTQNDGIIIPTIVINGVEWTMNLKETKWRDGTDIQNVTDNTAWSLLQSAACCDINNDPTLR